VERDGGGRQGGTQTGVRGALKTWLNVAGFFLWGLGIAATFGALLLAQRMPDSPWQFLLGLVAFIWITADLFRKDQAPSTTGCLAWALLLLCLSALYPLRTRGWAPVAAGVLFGAYFWASAKAAGRSYPILPAGCVLAGVSTLRAPWPNEQRCLLALVGVGVAVSLQGAWFIVQYVQGRGRGRGPAQPLTPAGSPRESFDRSFLHLIHWIFGAIGHVKITDPAFERRIRFRYQSEIRQLTDSEFAYLFSDGETFSLFRLPLLLPAIVLFAMWRNREAMTVYGGTKLLAGYPVLASKGQTTYAHADGHGVKFSTPFQDGTLLVSGNYADDSSRGPAIVKHSLAGSISGTWAEHQHRIQALEASGKVAIRQTGFQAYVEISTKETAAW
jgi:hypothetical protein